MPHEWCFYGAHVKNRSAHILGHNSKFLWASAGVKGNTCLSQPLYHYYSDLSVPNIHILLFLPKKKSLTTAPSSGLVVDSLTLATMKPLPRSENNLIVAHNIIDLLDLFVFFFEHGSQH